MPVLRGEDEEEREDVGGQAAVAPPLLRGAPPVRRDGDAAALREFLGWLMSKGSQRDMPGQGRSFRRRTARFWEVWPMPVADGEWRRVLICRSDERVVSWYMARSETSRAWSALMAPIPASDVVVSDGGTGFASAVRRSWPRTRVQRCVFHAFCQVRRYTTSRPRLQAGVEPCGLAGDLLHLETLHQAELWVERCLQWCGFWADFLEDTSVIDGRRVFTHERLRGPLVAVVARLGGHAVHLPGPGTDRGRAAAEHGQRGGGTNARLREMLGNHRGLSLMRRVKAVFWWCHMHSGDTRTATEKLATMPTDEDIDLLYRTYSASPKRDDGGPEWGDRAVWEELHHRDPFPWWLD